MGKTGKVLYKTRPIVDGKIPCSICGEWLPLDSFRLMSAGYRSGYCVICERHRVACSHLNMDVYDYQRMIAPHKCEICEVYVEVPNVDHEHSTGQLRGILCRSCNHGLGAFRDEFDLLVQAAHYISRWEGINRERPVTEADIERNRKMAWVTSNSTRKKILADSADGRTARHKSINKRR